MGYNSLPLITSVRYWCCDHIKITFLRIRSKHITSSLANYFLYVKDVVLGELYSETPVAYKTVGACIAKPLADKMEFYFSIMLGFGLDYENSFFT